MFRHKEEKILESNIETVYNLVSNVENYPQYIPWVSSTKVLRKYKNIVEYEVEVDFKVLKEKFSTKDTFYKNKKIEIELIEGPFKHLYNRWIFEKISENTTKVCFEIEFSFKSKILTLLLSKIFIEAQKKILFAFDTKLQEIKNAKYK